MLRIHMILSLIAFTLLLSQWYVITRIRKHLLGRYDPMTRRTAYPALALLSLGNFLALIVVFASDVLPRGSRAQQIAAASFFTYLGAVLMLCAVFLVLELFSAGLGLKDRLFRRILGPGRAAESRPAANPGALGAGEPGSNTATQDFAPHQAPLSMSRASDDDATCPAPGSGGEQAFAGSKSSPSGPSRRTFLKWGAATGVAGVGLVAGHGIERAFARPVVETFEIVEPTLAGLSRTLTFIQITDSHFGMFFGTRELEEVVRTANGIDADALFITGDVFHSMFSPVEDAIPVLRDFRPRPWGNFAVLGNHDFYTGEHRCEDALGAGGMRVLRDGWVTVDAGEARIHLGGMDDPRVNWLFGKEFPNFPAFMAKAPDGPGTKILLSHRPAILPLAGNSGIHLVLSGHIHGGQIVMPYPGDHRGISIARLVSIYTHGWYGRGTASMYLNRGVGLTFVPWRINCPPEVTVFRLRAPRPGEVLPESGRRRKVLTIRDEPASGVSLSGLGRRA